MTDLLHDGYHWGFTATWWTIAALTGAATIIAPWTLAAILLHRTWHQLTTTRRVWWARTLPARRRARTQHLP